MQTQIIPELNPTSPVVVPEFEQLSLAQVFLNASLLNQAVMLLLVVMAAAALALWCVWGGALLLGLSGASYTMLASFIGLANVRPTPSLAIMAPGFAEIMAQVMLGLLAATLAVVCHQDLNARLRRLVA